MNINQREEKFTLIREFFFKTRFKDRESTSRDLKNALNCMKFMLKCMALHFAAIGIIFFTFPSNNFFCLATNIFFYSSQLEQEFNSTERQNIDIFDRMLLGIEFGVNWCCWKKAVDRYFRNFTIPKNGGEVWKNRVLFPYYALNWWDMMISLCNLH